MDAERFKKWIQASMGLGNIEDFMIPNLQGLGRLDCQLISVDEKYLLLSEEKRLSIEESLLLTDRFTLSYLWVLGAYELVRSIDQKCRLDKTLLNQLLANQVNDLKHHFERLRIPLAKLEPASRHPSDNPIAFPVIDPQDIVAWAIAPNVKISRRELSDRLLILTLDIASS